MLLVTFQLYFDYFEYFILLRFCPGDLHVAKAGADAASKKWKKEFKLFEETCLLSRGVTYCDGFRPSLAAGMDRGDVLEDRFRKYLVLCAKDITAVIDTQTQKTISDVMEMWKLIKDPAQKQQRRKQSEIVRFVRYVPIGAIGTPSFPHPKTMSQQIPICEPPIVN